MLSSFGACCALFITFVLGARWFFFDSETSQSASATLVSGTVLLTRPGAQLSEAVVKTVGDVGEGALIESEAGSQAAVSFFAPDKNTSLGAIQIYGGSRVTFNLMRSPRFEWSSRPHRMVIDMPRGRARVSTAVDVARKIIITLQTPHGLVVLERAGSYSIEVNETSTEVGVHDGAATVIAQGQAVILAPGERTIVPAGGIPEGVLTGERNLLVNGDFTNPLSPDWTTYKDRYDPSDVEGDIQLTVNSGRNAVRFLRPGANWGRIGIRQKINRDVRDYQTLRLHLAVRLVGQNIPNCGSLGSECPLMVKIEYTDVAGNNHEWVQGFYYLDDVTNSLPLRCVTCPPPGGTHQHVQQNVWYLYDSPNLIELFKSAGPTPAAITAISIYAEGHAFDSLVSEIELLAGE